MKKNLVPLFAALMLAVAGSFSVRAADGGAATNDVTASIRTEVIPIMKQIQEKMSASDGKPADLAEQLKAIDAVIAKYQAQDKLAVGELYLLEAQLYASALENDTKAIEVLTQVQKDYRGTKVEEQAGKFIASIKAEAEAKKVRAALVPGSKFPDFEEKDLAGQPLSVAGHKGKVVLVDFWATWCPPCRAELPNVLAVYQKHHDQGFDIIGVSLDQDRSKLESFIKDKGMSWSQYFDGTGWSNKLAQKYGINSIPATFLLDGEGKIIAADLRGDDLEAAVAKALGK
ncbi:MAG TPA: TlpA disulfide reductase family protein [Dongiaceae bacterium]|nr:TlpA disulfide reductase family protein [Dongiaceae bacterium]